MLTLLKNVENEVNVDNNSVCNYILVFTQLLVFKKAITYI